jgi:hemoglobin/transferrin/lactoferrin receptor protein
VKVLSGGRYTHARAVAGAVRDPLTGQRVSIDDQWNSLIGSVRCGVFPGEGSSGAYAGLSQAFRAPNLSDLTRFDIARTKEIEIPAPGLDPERYVSAEVGLRFAAGSLQAGWAGYRTWIDGMIVRRPTGRIVNGNTEVTRANAGDGYVNGMEAFAEWRPDRGWALRGQVSWQLGEADQFPTSAPLLVREPLSRVMPLTGSVAVAWRAPHLPVTTELEVVAASRQHRLSTEDRRDTSRIPQRMAPRRPGPRPHGGESGRRGLSGPRLGVERGGEELRPRARDEVLARTIIVRAGPAWFGLGLLIRAACWTLPPLKCTPGQRSVQSRASD